MSSSKLTEAWLKCIDTVNNAFRVRPTSVVTEVVIDTDDDLVTLDSSYDKVVLTGGADNVTIDAGDATDYIIGKTFEIFNGSTEVAIIKNGDSSTFEFLVPRATAKLVCTSISTTNGTFEYSDDAKNLPPSVCTRVFDDWHEIDNGQVNRKMYQGSYSSGGATVLTVPISGARGGIGRVTTGTASASGESNHAEPWSYFETGAGAILFKARVRPVSSGGGTEDLIFWEALTDNLSAGGGSNPNDCIRFGFETANSANWLAKTFVSGTDYTASGGSPVAVNTGAFQNVVFFISSGGDRVDFYVGTTHIGTIINDATTRIPSVSDLCFSLGIEGVDTGTTDRSGWEDYHDVHMNLTTKRQ